ncbi:hypothetical protein OHA25_23140 [Nonomuraea sp. NBC_00507]|uniref:hypothetical protein n=1 Tax=Nonomuraea sp. NBC_00507 TaxID=2976002 RepID=UPI002E182A68
MEGTVAMCRAKRDIQPLDDVAPSHHVRRRLDEVRLKAHRAASANWPISGTRTACGLAAGVPTNDVTAFFPADFFVLIVGVTALFAVAQLNGTLDWLLDLLLRLAGGRLVLIALAPFAIGAVLTAAGTLPAAATAIVSPIALGFAARVPDLPVDRRRPGRHRHHQRAAHAARRAGRVRGLPGRRQVERRHPSRPRLRPG